MTPDRRRRLTLVAMCVSQGMILLDVTIVNIALPSIQRELHMTAGLLEWVVSAYALTLATLIPLGGTLGDRYGRRRLFLCGLALFTVASAACALSHVDVALIGFRVLQGVGGAVMSALTLSILSETYPPRTRATAIGLWAAVAGLGFGLGPVIGGLLLARFDWSAIFWVNVPVGVGAIVLTLVAVGESSDPVHRPLDVPGVVLSVAGLLGVTLGLIEAAGHPWGSAPVMVPLVSGAVLLVAFAVVERRSTHPMAPPALMADRRFSASCGVYLLAYLALASVMFFVTLLYQDVLGWSAMRTGLSWLCMNIPFLVLAQFSGRIHRHLPSPVVVGIGGSLAAVGVALLAGVDTTTPFVLAAAGYALLGSGYGMLTPSVATAAMRTVPQGASGVASGILNASRQVGTSVGLAVIGSLGVHAGVAAWSAHVAGLPPAARPGALALGSAVASGNVGAAGRALGTSAVTPAAAAFVHGYRVALVLSAVAVAAAAVLGALGLRSRRGEAGPVVAVARHAGPA